MSDWMVTDGVFNCWTENGADLYIEPWKARDGFTLKLQNTRGKYDEEKIEVSIHVCGRNLEALKEWLAPEGLEPIMLKEIQRLEKALWPDKEPRKEWGGPTAFTSNRPNITGELTAIQEEMDSAE